LQLGIRYGCPSLLVCLGRDGLQSGRMTGSNASIIIDRTQ